MILSEKSSELSAYVEAFESLKFDCNSKLLEGIMSAGLFLSFLSTAFWKLCVHQHPNNPVAFRFIFLHEVCCAKLLDVTSQTSIQKWYPTASWFWSLQKPYAGWLDFCRKHKCVCCPAYWSWIAHFLNRFSPKCLLELPFAGVSVLVCF